MIKRPPNEIIGEKYLRRWWLFHRGTEKPDSSKVRVYLHQFVGSDDDRAVHDHPGWSISFLLRGRLIEVMPYKCEGLADSFPDTEVLRGRHIPWLWPVFRKATHTHRMLLASDSAWTIFIMGPKRREWYFHCWRSELRAYAKKHWTLMTTATGETIGGCE